jgi:hypothetical protein
MLVGTQVSSNSGEQVFVRQNWMHMKYLQLQIYVGCLLNGRLLNDWPALGIAQYSIILPFLWAKGYEGVLDR